MGKKGASSQIGSKDRIQVKPIDIHEQCLDRKNLRTTIQGIPTTVEIKARTNILEKRAIIQIRQQKGTIRKKEEKIVITA